VLSCRRRGDELPRGPRQLVPAPGRLALDGDPSEARGSATSLKRVQHSERDAPRWAIDLLQAAVPNWLGGRTGSCRPRGTRRQEELPIRYAVITIECPLDGGEQEDADTIATMIEDLGLVPVGEVDAQTFLDGRVEGNITDVRIEDR
jgi:hypothetical protein